MDRKICFKTISAIHLFSIYLIIFNFKEILNMNNLVNGALYLDYNFLINVCDMKKLFLEAFSKDRAALLF